MKIESNYPQNTTPVSNRAAQPRPNAGVSASAEAVSLSTLAGTLQSGEKPPVKLGPHSGNQGCYFPRALQD